MIDLSDPISRQQTITALRALSDEDGYINAPHEVVTDVVRGLPPVQAEHGQTTHSEQTKKDKFGVKTGETYKDTISRQDAIDTIKVLREVAWENWHERTLSPNMVIDALSDLPSAEPERTCVNCGRTANNGGWYADGRTRCPIEEHYALPKDGFCHLWEKRNVTDDDYPERREK